MAGAFQSSAFQNNAFQTLPLGGGTSLPLPEPDRRRRDPRLRTGLVPLARRPLPPRQEPRPVQLPPYRDPPALAPQSAPQRLDVPAPSVSMLDQIRRDVMEAHRQSELMREDERDIAHIMAVLDQLD